MHRRRLLRLGFLPAALSLSAPAALGLLASDGWAAEPLPTRKPGTKPAVAKRRTVVIDPGHGGVDPGAIGGRGTLEKDVTLDIARELARLLSGRHGIGVTLTRQDDRFLPLAERVELARRAQPDLFLSIHADSAPNHEARGLSAYTLSDKASDALASALASKENRADELGGINLKAARKEVRDILLDLAARHTRRASLAAQQALVQGAGRDLRLLDNPLRSANFAVLKAPDVPSVLVETGFLSNPQDEAELRNPKARRLVARVLARETADLLQHVPFA